MDTSKDYGLAIGVIESIAARTVASALSAQGEPAALRAVQNEARLMSDRLFGAVTAITAYVNDLHAALHPAQGLSNEVGGVTQGGVVLVRPRVRLSGRSIELKAHPGPFANLLSNHKGYEIRKDDRAFMVGDVLRLREFDPNRSGYGDHPKYTGREVERVVTYKSEGGSWGLPVGLCVLSILPRELVDIVE